MIDNRNGMFEKILLINIGPSDYKIHPLVGFKKVISHMPNSPHHAFNR